MVPIRQTLAEMGWMKNFSPLQTNKSNAEGAVSNTIVPLNIKLMDLRFHWLHLWEAQNQLCYY